MGKVSRRGFLKIISAGATASSLGVSRLFLKDASAAPIAGRKVVNIFLNGGCDMFIPVQPTGFGSVMDQLRINRPTLGMPLLNNVGAPFTRLALNGSNYTLHDQMTEFQTLFNRSPRECAILLKGGILTNNTGSHEEAQRDHQTGVDNGNAVDNTGWIQKIMEANGVNDGFRVVDLTGGGIATGATVLSGQFRPTALNSLADFGYRAELGTTITGEYGFRMATAQSIISTASGAGATASVIKQNWAQLNQTVAAVGTAFSSGCGSYNSGAGTCSALTTQFPNTGIGRQLRDIYLSFLQLPAQFGYAETGGYDVHEYSDPQGQVPGARTAMSARLRDLNSALNVFRRNCEAAGIWDDMIIVINSEFGRTNRENVTVGLDHADASMVFLLGGAVAGGVYGQDFTVAELQRPQNAVGAQIKIRDVYCDIIEGLSMSSAATFPGFTRTPLGIIRPA